MREFRTTCPHAHTAPQLAKYPIFDIEIKKYRPGRSYDQAKSEVGVRSSPSFSPKKWNRLCTQMSINHSSAAKSEKIDSYKSALARVQSRTMSIGVLCISGEWVLTNVSSAGGDEAGHCSKLSSSRPLHLFTRHFRCVSLRYKYKGMLAKINGLK